MICALTFQVAMAVDRGSRMVGADDITNLRL